MIDTNDSTERHVELTSEDSLIARRLLVNMETIGVWGLGTGDFQFLNVEGTFRRVFVPNLKKVQRATVASWNPFHSPQHDRSKWWRGPAGEFIKTANGKRR